MKYFTSLLFGLLVCLILPAQVVLNEIYADPSPGNSEFFELYNTSYSGTPASMDGYSLITYFEEGSKKGFYVIDFPDVAIAPRGYMVGTSSIPFNYQGNIAATASDFNWNSPSLSVGNGYLKKWVATGNTATDGTDNYTEETLGANLNDFFSRLTGNGASYNAFVFKNGVLVNCFIGGTGGATKMPEYITNMPVFRLESVTASNNNTYNIIWGTFNTTKPEFVTQDIGTDNGFIRKRDGMCGTWVKSSSTVQHTPKITNGGSQLDTDGLLTINSHIYSASNPTDPAFVVYDITAGPSDLFPVALQVFTDNGAVAGELDANDTFIETNTENSLSDGSFTTYLTSQRHDVLIVAQTASGCFDQVILVQNPKAQMTTLPVKHKLFTGKQSPAGEQQVKVLQNPIHSTLSLRVQSSTRSQATIRLYHTNGIVVYTHRMTVEAGASQIQKELDTSITPGLYVLEVQFGTERRMLKVIKM